MNKSEAGKLAWVKALPIMLANRAKQIQISQQKYIKLNPYCAYCKVSIPYEKRKNKFCNHQCAAKFNNPQRRKCKKCKAPAQKGCRYCSSCTPGRNGIRAKWGKVYSNTTCKKLLVKECGETCSICKLSTWMLKSIPLQVDHIDGNGDNWNKNNVRLVCPNCHAQTPNYCSKNPIACQSRRRNRKTREFRLM